MNYVQIYISFQLFTSLTAFLYPCQYIDSTQYVLKCDICQCLAIPSIYSTSNLCLFPSSVICTNNSNEEFLRLKINEISENFYPIKNQIEFHHFNNQILNHEQLCLINNSSQITFYHFSFNNQIPKCLSIISSLRFVNSFIENNNFFSDKLIFYNTTFNIKNFHLNLTKILILHSIQFLIKPFQFNSLSSLTHLTITHTEDYHLIGSFPHLTYLNLCQTKLTDKQLNKFFTQVNLPDLTKLILSNNQLTIITNKFPSTIRYLDLSNNQIKSLDYYSFKSLYSLNILNLSFNSPLEIQQDTLTRIPYLEILDLSYTLPTLAFDDLFLPLQKLRHLNISDNFLDTLPQLPIPYDAHNIESYDHHLPVLYVDLSNNNFEKMDFEIFSTPSTQDKYILSLNMNNNRLKTFKFPSILLNDTKRRGPFIELDITNNPLECDCNLYETILHIFKNDAIHQKQTTLNLSPSFQQSPPSGYHSSHPFHYIRSRRHYNLVHQLSPTNFLPKQTRIKFLHLSNLTCTDMIEPKIHRTLFDINSSNSFCSYTKSCPSTCSCCSQNSCHCYSQCPNECSCKHSYDLITNYVNCSNRQLTRIPRNIPSSTTHLYLNNNQIKSIENNSLSLGKNSLEYLDLSSNYIQDIKSNIFSDLIILKKLYLHNNSWIPKFDNRMKEFQTNKYLILLTYANGSSCNRSTNIARPLTTEDCCKYSNIEPCQRIFPIKQADPPTNFRNIFILLFHQKYILLSLILFLLILLCLLIVYIYRRKRLLFPKEKYFSNADMKNVTRYNHQENDNSLSYTDEDDYAIIPLTISQTDLTPVIYSPSNVPPLPPPRYFLSHRPVSHSSTTSTSITTRSIKGPNSSSITTTRSCLQIKLDVLVLYSINDSEYIHENVGQPLENMYGKRFSFYFIHRDRMLGELEWLIENSCITILILRQPFHLIHDYMKILSTRSTIKCFLILLNNEKNYRRISIKVREKIARLYHTSNIYEWNSNLNSLIHEQLELFLEQNCGSATYVTD